MMKKDLFRYIFSLSLLLLIFSSSELIAQDENLYVQPEVKDTLKLKGIKFGVNVGRFSDFQFMPERFSYEGSVDFNLSNKYFGVVDAGYAEINLKKKNYHYLSEGYFVKLGMDFNMLKKYPSDFFGVGIKLGMANFSHQAQNIIIDPKHWEPIHTSAPSKNCTSFWLEASLGLKGEIFKNVYLGWSGLVKIRVRGGNDSNFKPYSIPGFGKPSSSIKLGANYYIYYQIPFNRN